MLELIKKGLGNIDWGHMGNRVCEYKDYPSNEWIANYLTMDGGALLYKEVNVAVLPKGLQSKHE